PPVSATSPTRSSRTGRPPGTEHRIRSRTRPRMTRSEAMPDVRTPVARAAGTLDRQVPHLPRAHRGDGLRTHGVRVPRHRGLHAVQRRDRRGGRLMPARILVIDNYDSFVYTLVSYVEELGATTTVLRNDAVTDAEAVVLLADHDGVLLSPGPGVPSESGVCPALIRAAAESGT